MKRELQRIIITGPTGVLGTALMRRMIQAGIEVYAVCHPGSKRNALLPKSPLIHKVECDMEDFAQLPDLIGIPCDVFYHFAWAGTSSANNRLDMYLQNANVKYSLDAVTAAHKLQCKVFIGAGSQAEYGRVNSAISPDTREKPISGYGMAKLCAGQMTRNMCQDFGLEHIWVRVLSTYGSGDNRNTLVSVVIQKLMNKECPALTVGEQVWDYLYAGDAAEAFYRIAISGHNGAVYVLGSGKTKFLREFMEIIRDEIDPDLPLGIGKIPYYKDQAMHLEADISALTRDTGWRPAVDFKEGIQAILAEYKSHR